MIGEDSDVMQFEQHRKEYIEIIRELRKKHPNMDMKSLEEMAEYEVRGEGHLYVKVIQISFKSSFWREKSMLILWTKCVLLQRNTISDKLLSSA